MLRREFYGLSQPIPPTIDVKSCIASFEGDTQGAMNCFRPYPHEAIRYACLKTIKEGRGLQNFDPALTDWIELTIEDLVGVGDACMAERVLKFYAEEVGGTAQGLCSTYSIAEGRAKFLMEQTPNAWKAVERLLAFAANVDHKHSSGLLLSAASKIIGEYMLYFWDGYASDALVPVYRFLRRALGLLSGSYSESDWHCAMHAVRIILKVGDKAFLPQLAGVIFAHEELGAGPQGSDTALVKAANLGVLKEAHRMVECAGTK